MAPIAPPIEGDRWFNFGPLAPEHLRGRVVVLVFWSAGCEASLHRLQQIDNLLNDDRVGGTGDAVIAVAVHTPRQACDDDVDRLHHVLRRHRVTMAVVHDPLYRTWSRFEPPGWPSTAVIDRNGRITGIAAGCHDFDVIEIAVADALSRPTGRRREDPALLPLPSPATGAPGAGGSIHQPTNEPAESDLHYPEGLAAIARRASIRLAVAEQDRLIVGRAEPDLRTMRVDVVVTGIDRPRTVVFTDPVTLAVVERGSNTVSLIDVSTGERSLVTADPVRPAGLCVDIDGSLVITDAGDDRLYRATANSDGSAHLVLPIAGSGRTGVAGGRAVEAELAQPVAAVRTGAGLVFADAASSNLRLLTDRSEVLNITDSDLFDWGLIDGPAHRARLQRPTDLSALPDGSIVVVDSGNNRLRRLHHRRIETIGLDGLDGPTAAVAIDGNRVVVTDTNHHRLIAVDPIRQHAWPVVVTGFDDARSVAAWSEAADRSADQVSSGSTTSAT